MRRLFLCLFLLTAGCFLNANQLYVTNVNDSGPGSLRYAIQSAAPGDSITVNIGNELVSHTINLLSSLEVSSDIIINGQDINSPNVCLTLNQTSYASVVNIDSGAVVVITNVTVTGGQDSGIKVASGATLDILDCTVKNCGASGGGGIYNEGLLKMTGCSIYNNSANGVGGGILSQGQNSCIELINSTIARNFVENNFMQSGAGIYIGSSALPSVINACTICYNSKKGGYTPSQGLGLVNAGSLYCYNSIIAGNNDYGTDIYNARTILGEGGNVVGSTFGYNWSDVGNWTTSGSANNLFTKVSDPAQTGYLYLDSALKNNGGSTQTLAITDTSSIARSIYSSFKDWKELTASDADLNSFGNSVAISTDGNTAIIGSPSKSGGEGAAYVFSRCNNTNSWSQQIKFTSSLISDTMFGCSVAVSDDGNTVVIGDPEVGGDQGGGLVFVYTKNGNSWQQTALTGNGSSFMFGCSVAVSGDGDTVVIGDYVYTDNYLPNGAVYVFTRNGSTWTQMKIEDPRSDYFYFGCSVSISEDGNTLIAGAPENGENLGGVAYVFICSGGVWTKQAELTNSTQVYGDEFGSSVAISTDGNTAIIGAPGDGIEILGKACIFTNNRGTWTQQDTLVASDENDYTYFGSSVATSGNGNTVVVGVHDWTQSRGYEPGASYVFTQNNNIWTQQSKLMSSEGIAGDNFGSSAAITPDGKILVIGMDYQDNDQGRSGKAYMFYGGSDTGIDPDVDQRNYQRSVTSLRSIGAYEFGADTSTP